MASKKVKAPSIKSITNMSAYQLSKLTNREVNAIYRKVNKRIEKNISTFKKHKVTSKNVEKYVDILNEPKARTRRAKELAILEATIFLKNKNNTYTNWKQTQKERRATVEKSTGIKFANNKEYEDFSRFLSDAYERERGNLKRHYDDAMDLWVQSRRLNIDTNTILRNWKYWKENVDSLKNAKVIDSGNKVNAREYAKQLKLPKLHGNGSYEN